MVVIETIQSREDVNDLLSELLGDEDRVYFNRPEDLKLTYPCILYEIDDYNIIHADNYPYLAFDKYQVTYIYQHESEKALVDKLMATKGFSFDRFYNADNLYHAVFTYHVY